MNWTWRPFVLIKKKVGKKNNPAKKRRKRRHWMVDLFHSDFCEGFSLGRLSTYCTGTRMPLFRGYVLAREHMLQEGLVKELK